LGIRHSNPNVTPFSVKPFLKRVVITPIGFGDKAFKSKRYVFLIKLFLKKFAVKPFSKGL
jgi:hypothetical protein